MNRCDPVKLERYLRGELNDAECAEVESHATECETCRALLDSAADAMANRFRAAWPIAPPPKHVDARIAEMVEDERRRAERTGLVHAILSVRVSRRMWAAVAGLAVVACALILLVRSSDVPTFQLLAGGVVAVRAPSEQLVTAWFPLPALPGKRGTTDLKPVRTADLGAWPFTHRLTSNATGWKGEIDFLGARVAVRLATKHRMYIEVTQGSARFEARGETRTVDAGQTVLVVPVPNEEPEVLVFEKPTLSPNLLSPEYRDLQARLMTEVAAGKPVEEADVLSLAEELARIGYVDAAGGALELRARRTWSARLRRTADCLNFLSGAKATLDLRDRKAVTWIEDLVAGVVHHQQAQHAAESGDSAAGKLFSNAERELVSADRVAGGCYPALAHLVEVRRMLQDLPGSLAVASQAKRLNPELGVVAWAIKMVGYTQDVPRATRILKSEIEKGHGDQWAWQSLAQGHEQQGDIGRALALRQAAAELFPDMPEIHEWIGITMADMDVRMRAAGAREHAVALSIEAQSQKPAERAKKQLDRAVWLSEIASNPGDPFWQEADTIVAGLNNPLEGVAYRERLQVERWLRGLPSTIAADDAVRIVQHDQAAIGLDLSRMAQSHFRAHRWEEAASEWKTLVNATRLSEEDPNLATQLYYLGTSELEQSKELARRRSPDAARWHTKGVEHLTSSRRIFDAVVKTLPGSKDRYVWVQAEALSELALEGDRAAAEEARRLFVKRLHDPACHLQHRLSAERWLSILERVGQQHRP